MPLIQIKVLEGVLSEEQKNEMISRVAETFGQNSYVTDFCPMNPSMAGEVISDEQ